jgi:hypothetical protein
MAEPNKWAYSPTDPGPLDVLKLMSAHVGAGAILWPMHFFSACGFRVSTWTK